MSVPLKAIICVEGVIERDAMQKQVDPTKERVLFIVPFQAVLAYQTEAIYCRYPNPFWYERTGRSEQEFQDWVRMVLSLRLLRGGDFQYI